MPPHPRRPAPRRAQGTRCRYSDGRQQCRRTATTENGLCRQCTDALQADLNDSDIIGKIDRMLVQNGQHPIAVMASGIIGGLMGRLFSFGQQQAAQQPPPSSQQQRSRPWQPPGQPPPPPSSPPPDPTIRAREILGFEPNERLTKELIHRRKQQLARVFHPDAKGGSDAQMKRVNAAADALLAKLS